MEARREESEGWEEASTEGKEGTERDRMGEEVQQD